MKDVISILQSRIAKRLKEFRKLALPLYHEEAMFGRNSYNLIRNGLPPNHPNVVALAKQQKEDKRILAEIVKLRREVKDEQVGRKDLHDIHLRVLEKHSKYIKKLQEQLKKEALDEILLSDEEKMQTAIMAAHFGER